MTAPNSFALVTGTKTLELPSTRWLVEDLIPTGPDGSLSLIFAPPASGKSLWALSLGLTVADGTKPFLGHKVEGGHVLYIAGEGVADFGTRIAAWSAHNKVAPSERFHLLPEPVDIPTKARALAEQLERDDVCPALIMVDTLARTSTSISESSTSGMGKLIEASGFLQTRFGAVVLFVHHSGRADPEEERGSGAMRGACDSVFRLERMGSTVEQFHVKSKYGAEVEPVSLAFIKAGDSVTLDIAPTPALPFEQVSALMSLFDSKTLKQWREDYECWNDRDFVRVARELVDSGLVDIWKGHYLVSDTARERFDWLR